MGRAWAVAVAGLMAATPAMAQTPSTETRVPVHQEPRHHVVFESASMRILDIQIPPGDQTLFHTHDTAILYVPIARSQTRSQDWGGEWSGGGAAPAAAQAPAPERPQRVNSVITYVEKPHTHRVNNTGTTLFRLVGIANRTAGDKAAATAATKPELENPWYRAERIVIAAGKSAPVSPHDGTIVIVMQTPGTAAVDGAAWSPLNGPGDFARIDGTQKFVVHNRGTSDIELVAVAVKGVK